MIATKTMAQDYVMPYLSPPAVIACKVCTYPAHGYHFKVMTCRACAAFFRRSLVAGMRYSCKETGSRQCPIDSTVRNFCKSCRFQKCLDVGMSADKIQQNRDPLSSTLPSTSSDFQPPEIDESVKKSIFNGPLYDFQKLIGEIRQIFSDTILEEIEFEKITETRLNLIKTAAQWMMYSDFFRNLVEREKMLILKTTWHVWARLELLEVSVEIFGEKVSRDKIVFISESEAVYLVEVFRNNLADLDPKEAEDVDRELQPLFSAVFDDVAQKLDALKPSQTEQAFILWQMVWGVVGKLFTGASLESGEKFMDDVCQDLHDYYKTDLQMVQYSQRVIQMMSIIRSMQKTYIDIHRVIDHANAFKRAFKGK